MKKILFLLLVCLIKLNAYEYLFYNQITSGYNRTWFFNDPNNRLRMKIYNNNTNTFSYANINYNYIGTMKLKNGSQGYITNDIFKLYITNDIFFLNDFYLQYRNILLNYFYNENQFSNTDYINYENYQILYDENGLAVESIVNGKWAGLYDDSGLSGNLYNEKGDLIYVNGVTASFFEKINNKLLRKFKINLEFIFIKNIFYPLLVLIFACVIFRSVIRMAFKAFLIRFYDKKIGQLEKRRENIENA